MDEALWASIALGKAPTLTNVFSCCSGAVSQSASLSASSTFLPFAGTVRYEPPQLPPPFGNALAISQPVTSGALPEMMPSIHGGHSIAANSPLAIDAFQSSDHWPE